MVQKRASERERERERLYYKLKQPSRIPGRPLAKQIIIYGFYLLDRPTTKMDCIKVTNVKLSYYDYYYSDRQPPSPLTLEAVSALSFSYCVMLSGLAAEAASSCTTVQGIYVTCCRLLQVICVPLCVAQKKRFFLPPAVCRVCGRESGIMKGQSKRGRRL